MKWWLGAVVAVVGSGAKLGIEYSLDDQTWRSYSAPVDISTNQQEIAGQKSGRVVGPIEDEANLCNSLWTEMTSDHKSLYLRTLRLEDNQQLGRSSADLTKIRSYKQLCVLLANMELAVDRIDGQVVRAMMRAPTHLSGLEMSLKRVGYIKLFDTVEPVKVVEKVLVEEPVMSEVVLEEEVKQPPPQKSNIWFGLMVGMIVMQIVTAYQNNKANQNVNAAAQRASTS